MDVFGDGLSPRFLLTFWGGRYSQPGLGSWAPPALLCTSSVWLHTACKKQPEILLLTVQKRSCAPLLWCVNRPLLLPFSPHSSFSSSSFKTCPPPPPSAQPSAALALERWVVRRTRGLVNFP